jgi:hypothetical protein
MMVQVPRSNSRLASPARRVTRLPRPPCVTGACRCPVSAKTFWTDAVTNSGNTVSSAMAWIPHGLNPKDAGRICWFDLETLKLKLLRCCKNRGLL